MCNDASGKRQKACATQIYARPTRKTKAGTNWSRRPFLQYRPARFKSVSGLRHRSRGDGMQDASMDLTRALHRSGSRWYKLELAQTNPAASVERRNASERRREPSHTSGRGALVRGLPVLFGVAAHRAIRPKRGRRRSLLQPERIRASQQCVVVTARRLRIAKAT